MILFDKYLPGIAGHETWLYTAFPNTNGVYEIPFMVSMGWAFFFSIVLMVIISFFDKKERLQTKGLEVDTKMFRVSNSTLVMSLVIIGVLLALYIIFW